MGYFFERYKKICPDFEPAEPSKKYLRVNTLKNKPEQLNWTLTKKNISLEKTPLNDVYAFDAEFAMSSTTEHLTGKFYLQGLASAAVTHALKPTPDSIVIDMAAAPGSKATHMAQFMNDTGKLLALDKSSSRLDAVRQNTERLGITNTIAIRKDARFATDLKIQADYVLLDAPCSGNFCSEDEWEDKRTIADIKQNARMQRELMKTAARLLKEGGTLVYSTCSLEPEEDELIANFALKLGLELVETGLPDLGQVPGITEFDGEALDPSLSKTARFWPHKTGTEGFFVAKFRKTTE